MSTRENEKGQFLGKQRRWKLINNKHSKNLLVSLRILFHIFFSIFYLGKDICGKEINEKLCRKAKRISNE